MKIVKVLCNKSLNMTIGKAASQVAYAAVIFKLPPR